MADILASCLTVIISVLLIFLATPSDIADAQSYSLLRNQWSRIQENCGEVSTLFKPSRPLLAPGPFMDDSPQVKTAQFTYGMLDGILPSIPNLQAGYLYSFGKDYSLGRFVGDLFVPWRLKWSDTFFGQAHIEFQDFWQIPDSAPQHRVDLSFGGGYRKLIGPKIMVGFNAFYDSTRILGDWWSAAGVGAEMAAILANRDVLDLSYNYYGNLFRGPTYVDGEIIKGPPNMDLEAGYTTSLFERTPDLRFKINAYNYDTRQSSYGLRGGVDIMPWNGSVIMRYEIGRDQLYGSYQTVGGFINIPLNLEKIGWWDTPFVKAGGPAENLPKAHHHQPFPAPGVVMPLPGTPDQDYLKRLMEQPVRRQFASHAVSAQSIDDAHPPTPTTFVASGDAEVVFTLYPKYTAAMLNNIKPSTIQVSASATSRGSVDITNMQLYVKDSGVVWSLSMPDWTVAMGRNYVYNLTPANIDNLWAILAQAPDRSIAEVRFNQLTGANLQNLNISLTITQAVITKKSSDN
ncbi:MAG: inverse autotransporter beta domain-containing protein [Pseudomonadota bacterium]